MNHAVFYKRKKSIIIYDFYKMNRMAIKPKYVSNIEHNNTSLRNCHHVTHLKFKYVMLYDTD